MNLNELHDLVVVRNHLKMLLNDRQRIPNNELRKFEKIATDMDACFLRNVDVLGSNFIHPVMFPAITSTSQVVVTEPLSKQLELFTDNKAASNVVLAAANQQPQVAAVVSPPEPSEEEKEIAAKIAKAKADVKTKQKKNGGFKRSETDD